MSKAVTEFQKMRAALVRMRARADRALETAYVERFAASGEHDQATLEHARAVVMQTHMLPTQIATLIIAFDQALEGLDGDVVDQ